MTKLFSITSSSGKTISGLTASQAAESVECDFWVSPDQYWGRDDCASLIESQLNLLPVGPFGAITYKDGQNPERDCTVTRDL